MQQPPVSATQEASEAIDRQRAAAIGSNEIPAIEAGLDALEYELMLIEAQLQ